MSKSYSKVKIKPSNDTKKIFSKPNVRTKTISNIFKQLFSLKKNKVAILDPKYKTPPKKPSPKTTTAKNQSHKPTTSKNQSPKPTTSKNQSPKPTTAKNQSSKPTTAKKRYSPSPSPPPSTLPTIPSTLPTIPSTLPPPPPHSYNNVSSKTTNKTIKRK